ncbi:HD domain-containing protein [Heliobacterium gestii]|uniref:HD domain-containing protein n=1 Tax=Heliomicrobium gestii TaxID=2699 RepID=A0A845LBH3_HELGE|nr:HD domain-containing phosphohydrolase [Heliomicrobium gestii]MBM7866287.1 putative nucleotidyltransferase with HDIG domain [Heliomicrobium gestii]MZP42921.1 HD domain-containing protein [Heliomicrobium gestii]
MTVLGIRGTAFRFWLALTALSLAGILVMAGYFIRTEGALLEAALRNEALAGANLLASAVGSDVQGGDVDRINSLSWALLNQPNIQYVRVIDANGRVMTQREKAHYVADVLTVQVPVLAMDKKLGMVEIAVRMTELRKQQKYRFDYTVAVACLASLGAGAFAAWVSRRLTLPLVRLTEAARRVADGDRAVCVPEVGTGETAALAAAFNQMAAAVADHRASLQAEIRKATISLAEKVETLEAMDRIFRSVMAQNARRDEVIKTLISHIQARVTADALFIAVWDEGTKTAEFYMWEGRSTGIVTDSVPLDQTRLPAVADEGQPRICADLSREDLCPQEEEFLALGYHSIVYVPVMAGDKALGTIIVSNREAGFYADGTVDRLMELAQAIAIALKSAHAYASLNSAFWQMIRTLSRAIDMRDAYTGGHSEQVMLLSRTIARLAGLSDSEIETVGIAGLLHDVGKIGIRESILQKPGPLSAAEFNEMKSHSALGAELLRPIGLFRNVADIVYHHHEHYDGRGYPVGLAGENIPIASRVIAIADAIDAMASSRPYRKGLPPDVIREELRKHAGAQFDPRLVEIVLRHFDELITVVSRTADKAV